MASEENAADKSAELRVDGKQNITGVALKATLIENKMEEGKSDSKETPPVVTHHAIEIAGQTLRYTVTTGLMPIKNEAGETEANMFFMAYTRDERDHGEANAGAGEAADTSGDAPRQTDTSARPLMFSFNGGPGSSSVWLHLGALGPKRVVLEEDGSLPPPPYRMADNPHTWLDKTDLVFIDPIGTGYSRPVKPEDGKKFWSVEGDIAAMGEFIRLYLTRYERWTSPLYLVGESYGTTRAAGLAGYLIDRGIAFNGIALVSSILNFQTALAEKGNDLPYILFLPTYTATAWYHKRLAPDLQQNLRQALDEAEQWAGGEYSLLLSKGDALTPEERQNAIRKLARYTGLSESYVDDSDLRIDIFRFCKELLRGQKRTVGRLDSRLTGWDARGVGDSPEFDPSMATIRPPYTAVFNHYVRADLGYKTDLPYYILGGGIKTPWDWNIGQGYVDTAEALRSAFAKNPHMRLFVASGYYDLATPYFATDYTLRHMGLEPSVREKVVTCAYEAGHMMYIHAPSLAQLKADIAAFIR